MQHILSLLVPHFYSLRFEWVEKDSLCGGKDTSASRGSGTGLLRVTGYNGGHSAYNFNHYIEEGILADTAQSGFKKLHLPKFLSI